jgi:hypothetical protein
VARGEPFRETLANAYYLRDDFDARTYPAARKKRSGPPPTQLPGNELPPSQGGSLGRPRVFPFVLHQTATRRNSVCTPLLLGNVLIQSYYIATGTYSDPPNMTIEIGYQLIAGAETNALLTTPRPYTVLTEFLDPHGIVAADRGQGFPQNTTNSPQRGTRIPLGLYVLERECAVVIADVNPSGFVQDYYGYLNLIENLSVDQISRALGAP